MDEQWDIFALIDLEWICVLSAEMIAVPCWDTSGGIDRLIHENLQGFIAIQQEFMGIFEAEEAILASNLGLNLSSIMRPTESWMSDGVWC